MIVCDRCQQTPAKKVHVHFTGEQKKPGPKRKILMIPMELCEECITAFLRSFGRWKNQFMKEGSPLISDA